MNELIKYGWIKRDFNSDEYKLIFLRISTLIRLFNKKENFEYLIIDYYFVSNNNLYFIYNEIIYCLNLYIGFNYKSDLIDLEKDFNKIIPIDSFSIEKIIELDIISKDYINCKIKSI